MVDFKHKFKDNRLCDREDIFNLFIELSEPLKKYYSEKCAFLKLDNFGAHYDEKSSFVEGFSRVVWGLAPFIAGGGNTDFLDIYINGIENGTDPKSAEYWGDLHDVDQKIVELASLSLFLLLAPERSWEPLKPHVKRNFAEYLYRVNEVVVPKSNWLFFRVLVNIALKKTGNRYSEEMLEEDLAFIDSFYIGNGFYSDGRGGKIDYYNPFAIHFYSLIYAKFMREEDRERCSRFIERSSEFAKQFIYWFDNNGAAVPFGRSMTYRFAMSSYFGALAFCNVEALPWNIIKTVVLKNMRWWLDKPIFARDGILSVGYGYTNLIMSEEYNSPTSPYWAFKWFIILAVDKEHPFWKAEEQIRFNIDSICVQKEPGFLIQRTEDGDNVNILSSGQYILNNFSNLTAKYSKFVYSTKYAFSVSRGCETLNQGAFDSMLALREDGDNLFHVRTANKLLDINENYILSEWMPYNDVRIMTYLIPCGDYHIRIHRINSARHLYAAEGGFAVKRWENERECIECTPEKAIVKTSEDISAVIRLFGYKSGITALSTNANLNHPRTVLPMLEADIPPGECILACAVFAGSNNEYGKDIIANTPELRLENNTIHIIFKGTEYLAIN